MINDHLIIQKIIRYSIKHYSITKSIYFEEFHDCLCKLILISKSWLVNILPKIKYPLLSVERKDEWEKVVNLIVKQRLPLRLTFSIDSLRDYSEALSKSSSMYQKFIQLISGRSNYGNQQQPQMNIEQFINVVGPHFDSLSFNHHYESGFKPLSIYFNNLFHQQYKLSKFIANENLMFPLEFSHINTKVKDLITHLKLYKNCTSDLAFGAERVFSDLKSLRKISIEYEPNSNGRDDRLFTVIKSILANRTVKRFSLELLLTSQSLSKSFLIAEITEITFLTCLKIHFLITVQQFESLLIKSKSLLELEVHLVGERFKEGEVEIHDFYSSTTITNNSLKSLSLQGVSHSNKYNYMDILVLPNLTNLTIDEFNLNPMKGCQNIKTFSITLDSRGMENNRNANQFLQSPSKPKLEKLAIDCKFVHSSSLQYFISSTLTSNPLKNLFNIEAVCHLELTKFIYKMEDLTLLFKLLSKQKHICIFEFKNCQIDKFLSLSFQKMMDAMVENTQFTSLNVSNIGLSIYQNTILLFKVLEDLNLIYLNVDYPITFDNNQVQKYKELVKKNINNLLILNYSICNSVVGIKFHDKENRSFLNSKNILTLFDNKILNL
ncbi:hypothetical protein CYY_006842 [Polysphondylium violaceum]|uniref:Uncharacterized protein n=1 Tax=Polysphondylium violaceum TaxID=133409 RepID=A0A8J4UY09_9MYCE|nr:hypothetical protein CYY_006842 [Polysphondylium violaceum]